MVCARRERFILSHSQPNKTTARASPMSLAVVLGTNSAIPPIINMLLWIHLTCARR